MVAGKKFGVDWENLDKIQDCDMLLSSFVYTAVLK
jgi:hypothetical protein